MASSELTPPPEPAGGARPADCHWPAVLAAVADPAFMHDTEFRIRCANRAYAALAGLDMAAIIGRPYWEIFPKGNGPLPGCAAAARQSTHGEISEEVTAQGRIFHSRALALYDAAGVYQAAIHILEDISERRWQETELRYQQGRLEEIERVFRLGITTLRSRAKRDALSQELAYLATHDRLTGLPNRPLLLDRLQQAVLYGSVTGAWSRSPASTSTTSSG